MFETALCAALTGAVVSGGALFGTAWAEHRRKWIHARLNAMVAKPRSDEQSMVLLRRPRFRPKAVPTAFLARVELGLAAAGGRIRLPHLAAAGIISAASIAIAAAFAGLRPALTVALCGTGALGIPALLVQWLQSRYQRQFLDAFPDALDLIVRAVRAGLPVSEAMDVASREVRPPVNAELQRLLGELRIGRDMHEVLQGAADRIRVPDFQFFAVSLLLQRQTGGGIAETLANLSGIIRQRKALRSKARALTAEAKASAVIVAATPFVAGLGLFMINRQLMWSLFADPRGRFMLGLAIASLLLGVLAMQLLIRRNLH